MTDRYSQTVDVEVKNAQIKYQILGISSILIGLGAIVLSVFISYYFMFGLAVFGILGIVFIHEYNGYPKEFTYELSLESFVVIKKDLVNRQKRILYLLLKDIEIISVLDGLFDDTDLVACSKNSKNMYQIIYNENDQHKRLIISPDEYMIALLNEKENE